MGIDIELAAFVGSWLTDTYWYVPASYLPALLAINATEPRIVTVQDQTVCHITNYSNGYISGISASNIGFGWSDMLIVGSVMPNRMVKLSFSPLTDANSSDPSTQSITIGDGALLGERPGAEFLMQMTMGTPTTTLTHWGANAAGHPRRFGMVLSSGLSDHRCT